MEKIQYRRMNKYRNKKVAYNGITFDSMKEKRRYIELKLLEDKGIIKDLVIQPKFPLLESFKYKDKTYRGITYYGDFGYIEGSIQVVEDIKSAITKKDKVYVIKKKLLLNKYPDLDFREID